MTPIKLTQLTPWPPPVQLKIASKSVESWQSSWPSFWLYPSAALQLTFHWLSQVQNELASSRGKDFKMELIPGNSTLSGDVLGLVTSEVNGAAWIWKLDYWGSWVYARYLNIDQKCTCLPNEANQQMLKQEGVRMQVFELAIYLCYPKLLDTVACCDWLTLCITIMQVP